MHINDLAEFVASNGVSIVGAKDGSGANSFTVAMSYRDKLIQSVGSDLGSCVASVQESLNAAVKSRGVFHIH